MQYSAAAWVLTFRADDEARAHGGLAAFGEPVTGPDLVALQRRVEAGLVAYESAEGMPRFVKSAVNRWSVHPRSEASCLVRTHATLELRGPLRLVQFLLAWRLQADGASVLEDLRYQVEHGRPHPRKLAAT